MAIKQDTQSHYYHKFQNNKQNWAIDAWLRGHGISASDLETHPRIQNVIALLNIRQSFWTLMNDQERGVWAAYWSIVYHKRRPLKPKAWDKFEKIAKSIDNRQQLIHQLRATRQNQNKGRNITANCPDQPDSKLVKRESLGGREEQSLLPWE